MNTIPVPLPAGGPSGRPAITYDGDGRGRRPQHSGHPHPHPHPHPERLRGLRRRLWAQASDDTPPADGTTPGRRGGGRGGRRGGTGPEAFGSRGTGPEGVVSRGTGPEASGGPEGFGSDSPGRRGFGPGGRRGHRGGPGFGRFGGFGPGPGRGRGRASRGDVRAAVLALLAEQPLHGYAVIGLLAERSGGLWRPSPGSVYPVLAQLEEEGLVAAEESYGRRVFALTEAGRTHVAEHADELKEPWNPTGAGDLAAVLFDAMRNLGGAAREVARGGDAVQIEAARTVLESSRRSLYRILADDVPVTGTGPDGDGPGEGTGT